MRVLLIKTTRSRCIVFSARRPRIMASILKVDEMQGVTSAGDITITSEGGVPRCSCSRAVVKVGYMQVVLLVQDDTFNVSGGTDHGTGDYSHTITNPFSNLNYCQHSTAKEHLLTEMQQEIVTGMLQAHLPQNVLKLVQNRILYTCFQLLETSHNG